MSTTLKLNDAHDLDIVNNNFVVVDGITALRDRLATNLKTFQSEWYLDPTLGIPYFEQVFTKAVNVGVLYTIFSGVIRRTEGVAAVNSLVFDQDNANRVLTITFSVTADDGTILEETISLEGV
jgi:hypothetical protein